MEGFTRANLFELFGDSIQVSYASIPIGGGPILSYRDAQRSLSFRGADIRAQETELGELITVTLEAIPDLRTMTFTLMLPIVTVMPQSSGTYIRVPGVTATTPTTLAGPPPGPERLYAVVTLQGTAQFANSPTYFRFTDTDGKPRFVIELRDPNRIAHARRILSGEERSRIHVQGTVVKASAHYNPGWSFHLAPESIDFFELAAEVCDASMQYVEDHLDEVGGSTLPGAHWCPWLSRLVDEVLPGMDGGTRV